MGCMALIFHQQDKRQKAMDLVFSKTHTRVVTNKKLLSRNFK
jgi:hypothetical protein